jgi:uncharacterized membrane protein YgcG
MSLMSSGLRNARRFTAGIFAAVSLAILAQPVAGQRQMEIERFDATIRVDDSGWIDVREEVRVRFIGSWNGIFRTIPIEYRTDQGFSYRLVLDDLSVTGTDGSPYEYSSSRERHYRLLKIRVPGATDATRTVVIHYRVPNALKFWDEYDELYWNVTGDEWDVPISAASAMVILPDGVTGVRTASWTGGHGSTENAASVEEVEDALFFETRGGLNYREGLTIAVAWDPGAVARPSALDHVLRFLRANWLLLFPFVSLWGMWRLWAHRGRDPTQRSITARYEPPDGMTPAEAGTLLDNRPDMRDITAALVDLAVRGFLRIEEVENDGLLSKWVGKADYILVPVKPREAWIELKSHEQKILTGVFGITSAPVPTRMSDLEHEFYQSLPEVKSRIFGELIQRGYYLRRPDKIREVYMGVGFAVLALGLAGGLPLAAALQISPLTAGLAAVGTALPVLIFGFFMPARTERGARALERVLGFEEFLDRVESDRYRRMVTSPEMFERFLPYAMAFGVEKKWAAAFDGIYEQPPNWYAGRWDGGFRPSIFVHDMGRMSTAASAAMVSAPRSSGGSGFSGGGGGGFSGGGFGGGGGGGW